MYQRDLDKILNKKVSDFPKSLMLFGENQFLINFYSKKIEKFLNTEEVHKIYSVDYDYHTVRNIISQSSLFGDSSLVIIEAEKKIPTKELESLISGAENNPDNYFLYLYFGDDFKSSFKAFQTKNQFVRFFNMNPNDIWFFLKNEVALKNLQIDDSALGLLIHFKDEHIELILPELDKLKILNKNITEQDIIESVYILENVKFEKYLNQFLFSGEHNQLVETVFHQHIEPTVVVIYFGRLIEELILRRINFELSEDFSAFAVLKRKLPPNIDNERMALTQQNDLNRLQKLLELIIKYELKYKSGKIGDKYSIFISMIFEIKNTFFRN